MIVCGGEAKGEGEGGMCLEGRGSVGGADGRDECVRREVEVKSVCRGEGRVCEERREEVCG